MNFYGIKYNVTITFLPMLRITNINTHFGVTFGGMNSHYQAELMKY